jgi:DNA-directed RNA polymerase specialized sigma24 family protein/ribosome-associated translation inhibitor RaiA
MKWGTSAAPRPFSAISAIQALKIRYLSSKPKIIILKYLDNTTFPKNITSLTLFDFHISPSHHRCTIHLRKHWFASFVGKPGVLMNVHFSYRLHKTPAVEKDVQHQIEKLRKRLQVFRPELIHLKGVVEEISPREGTSVSLNLRLPSGQMAVEEKATTAAAAVKSAFEDLLQQVGKHKDLLRSAHKWTRRQKDTSEKRSRSVPFEQTLAAVFPPQVSSDDVRSYVNVNLSRLELFVEREIYFRENSDDLAPDSISKEEVIDETIAAALGEVPEKPERLALEPWLYRLALNALDQLSRADDSNATAVHLEESARPRNIKASDEPELQFHQPDEAITAETIIADDRVSTPEEIVGSDELVRLIAASLRDIASAHREAFILHAVEGFGVGEISAITGVPQENVLHSISAARAHLRKSPGLARQFKGRFTSAGTA